MCAGVDDTEVGVIEHHGAASGNRATSRFNSGCLNSPAYAAGDQDLRNGSAYAVGHKRECSGGQDIDAVIWTLSPSVHQRHRRMVSASACRPACSRWSDFVTADRYSATRTRQNTLHRRRGVFALTVIEHIPGGFTEGIYFPPGFTARRQSAYSFHHPIAIPIFTSIRFFTGPVQGQTSRRGGEHTQSPDGRPA